MAIGGLDIGSLFGRISLEDAFSGVLEKVEAKLESTGERMSGFGEKVKSAIESPLDFAKTEALAFVEALGPIGVVVGTAAVVVGTLGGGLFELASHAGEAAEEIERFTHVTGMAAEAASELKTVADIGGSSLGQLQGMLFQTERRLQATGEAGEKVNRALEDMKIGADEFRNATPEDKIRLLSEGLHNAQGSATMMADAMAVMGRGARENIPFLLKNFDELEERAHRVAYVWSEEDVEAGERFEQQVNELKEGIGSVATAVGVELLPAMTGLVAGIEKVGVALYTITGLEGYVEMFRALKGYLGEDELALQTQAALTESMDKRWADAAKKGLDLGEAAYAIAEDMLKAGYSVKTVGEQTGLAADQVNRMKGEMDNAAKAAIAQGEAWDRISQSFDGFSDIDPEIKGLVKDMFDAKVSIEDMATVTKLSKETLKSLTDQFKESEKAEKEFGKAWEDLSSLGTDFKQTLAGVDASIAGSVQYYASLGAKVEDLVKAFPTLTKAQAEAAVAGKKAADDTSKAWEKLGELWTSAYEKKAELEATDSEKIVIAAEKEYETRVKAAQDANITDVEYYNQLWTLRQTDIDNNQTALDKQELAKKQAYLKDHEARNQEEAAIQQHMNAINGGIDSMGGHVKQQVVIAESLATAWSLVADGIDAANIKVKALDGSMETLAEAQKRFDMGSSFTYDMSTDEGIAQYRKMNPAANITWSDAQIEAYIKKGGTLQGLIASGVILPYGNMGHAALGGTVTVGEHGPELVQLPVGSTVFPHGTGPTGVGGSIINNNFYVQAGTAEEQARNIKGILMRDQQANRLFGSV